MTTRVTPLRTAEFGLSLAELTEHLDIAGRGPPHPGNLPVELTRLLGREAEVAELAELLVGTRLLTLAGPGGAGKSRLALTVARQCEEGFDGGAWWLDLGAIEEGAIDLMLLGARAADNPMGDVISHLPAVSASLLVLDNCEHVVEASARLVSDLLAARPELTVIATTRRPLGVPGEQLWRVPGLGLPPPLRDYGLDPGPESDDAPAVRLFLERARAVAPSFALNDGNRRSVIQICWWLDGLPLALELAAARVAVLSATDIAGRLERDPSLLSRSTSIAPARQRTLEATLDWSYNLLSPAEQVLFRRLGAFAGSFSLDGAEAVCGGEPLGEGEIFGLLASLIDQSLVHTVERGSLARYRLPPTVSRYAAGRLAGSGEEAMIRDAHAAYMLRLAGSGARLSGAEQATWFEWLSLENDNIRAALGRLLPEHPEDGGRLAGMLWPFWYRFGYYDEARRWLDAAFVLGEAMAPATRAAVLAGSGTLAFLQCDYAPAKARLESALALYLELGDRPGGAATLQRLGSIEREQGRYESARDFHERALALWQDLGDEAGVAASLDFLAFAAWLSGEFEQARELGTRALALFRAIHSPHETASCLINLGAAAHYAGDDRAAIAELEEALATSRELGYLEGVAWALNELAIVSAGQRDAGRTAAMLRESLIVHFQLGDRWRACSVLEEIAAQLARRDSERACELMAAADAQRDVLGTPLPPAERPGRDRAIQALQGRLKPAALQLAWERGGAISFDRAFVAAVGAIDEHFGQAPPSTSDPAKAVLSDREQLVLRLVCAGRTNREIGEELFISPSTAGVHVHVSNILRKLGAKSRAEAANLAVRLGVLRDDGPGP